MINKSNKSLLTDERVDEPAHFSGGLIARNTIYNILGYVLPLPVALITIPYLIKGMGTERFGVLTVAWMIVGYFGLFDIGVGRATTKFVAEYLARNEMQKLKQLIWASIVMLLVFGLAATGIAILLTPWLVNNILNIPSALADESIKAFYLLAISIPIVLGTSGARGVLEAQQRFAFINIVKTPTYIAAFVSPLLILPFSVSLFHIVAALVTIRLIGLCAYVGSCLRSLPGLIQPGLPPFSTVKQLLRFGGWISISNVVAPLMGNIDRFFIGAILTMTAVTYYATPFDFITKLFLLPIGILGVIFPAFSAYSVEKKQELASLHQRAVIYILILMTPLVVSLIVFAEPLLQIWLGDEFARQSAPVLQILASGVLFSSVARVPFNALQATGRPDLTAKLFLIELPVYIAILVLFIKTFGIVGAALTWLMRLAFETVVLFTLFRRTAPYSRSTLKIGDMSVYSWMTISVAAAYAVSLIPNIIARLAGLTVSVCLVAYLAFSIMLDTDEKGKIRGWITRTSGIIGKVG